MTSNQTPAGAAPTIEMLDSKTAFSCRWYKVRKDAVRFPNGEVGEYNVVDVPPCIFVVPITTSGEIVLIHQYRYPLDEWVWEVPAGGLHLNKTALETVEEELREEIGGVARDISYLGKFYTSNGFTNEVAHLYIAWDVVLGEQETESAEIITVHPTPLNQVLTMIHTNELKDAPSALAVLLALPHLKS